MARLAYRVRSSRKRWCWDVCRLTDTACRLATMAAPGSKKHATSAIIERDDEALLLVISRGLGATLILLLLAITGFLFIQEIGSIIKAPSQSITGHVATELARALYEALHSLYATLGQLAWTLNAAMYGPDFSTSRLLACCRSSRECWPPMASCLAPTGHHSRVYI